MADQEEDFSSLPLPDRFCHKNWKVRKGGYEDAVKAFEVTPDESDPAFRPFLQDSSLWKGAVADSNVAAQQDGINALCAFLKFGGREACTRSRHATIASIIEKGLPSTRAATKQSSLEALLLYIELDKADPVIEELLPGLSNKQPKIIAATLAALTSIIHAYGVKIVDPKPVLKSLPKAFGHADKNARAEAQNLAVELYRWLREAMKPVFWGELKPVQQQDLEKLFEGVKQEGSPRQERLLRSQQAAKAVASAAAEEDDNEPDEEEAPAEVDAFDFADPIDVLNKIPSDFYEKMGSAKWKDRKDALDALYEAANTEKIKDGHYDEVVAALVKSMKDANITVVTAAANCIECLAKGLRQSFAKHRSKVMPPIMEKLKEKKQSVADALGSALDAVFAATSLTDCLEDVLEFLKHKNPQVKSETLKFLIRCLRTTREAPSKPEVKSIADAATKLLTESVEATRSGGAEVLGTLMKIMGERAMGPYLEGLDDIRKTKIKEYCDAAEVKAKDKPKPVAPPPKAAPPGQKRVATKKAPTGPKKPTPRASTPQDDSAPTPRPPATKGITSKLAAPKALVPPQKPGLQQPKKLSGPGGAAPPTLQSPRRNITPQDEDSVPAPKLGRGLAGRPLGRPTPLSTPLSPSSLEPPIPAPNPSLSAAEHAELEEIRTERERLVRTNEELRIEKSKLTSQIHELQNQNAQLIEDHTRDVLSIKAKETQLVRARSDAEAAEQTVQRQQREMERLKREIARSTTTMMSTAAVRERSPPASELGNSSSIYRDASASQHGSSISISSSAATTAVEQQRPPYSGINTPSFPESKEIGYQRARSYMSSPSEEKENGGVVDGGGRKKEWSPVKGSLPPSLRRDDASGERDAMGVGGGGEKGESWKRAAEVTNQLKARIEQMKVSS
ncbi:MAG: hypothetical protein Q9190_005204 [Brigantiaea leucoxantha]